MQSTPKKSPYATETQGLGITSSPSRTRTYGPVVNSHLLYRLSYRGV